MARPGKKKKANVKEDKPEDGAINLLRKLGNQSTMRSKLSLTDDQAVYPHLSNTTTSPDTMDMNCQDNEMLPDWYEDLTDDHTSAFKELFDLLDSSKTGLLNADSLYEGLKRVDNDITKEEVVNVLKTLDKDGNGEIDFDEFLFHMTQGDLMGETEDGDKKKGRNFSRRQRLFYTAITEFSLKSTIGDIERSYLARIRQAPHVLSHYTAGVRLIGLTDRQLARQMQKMQKSARKNDSPYAKPLPYVSQGGALKPTRIRKQVGGKAISKYKISKERKKQSAPSTVKLSKPPRMVTFVENTMNKPEVVVEGIPPEESPLPDLQTTLHESLELWDKGESIVSRLPGSHLIAKIRAKMITKRNDLNNLEEEEDEKPDQESEKLPDESTENHTHNFGDSGDCAKGCKWRIPHVPKIEKEKVPLPVLKIKYLKHRPTIDDLPNIREKATQAINDYYQSMRRATVQNAHTHWNKLYADTIRPKKLLENFRIVYRAYSPHKEEEAFVVCPWIPGPYRHFRKCTMSGRYNQGSPDFRMEKVYRTGLSPELTSNKRPFSVH